MEGISYISCTLHTQERKLSFYDQELCDITFAFTTYEFVIGSSQITSFPGHNPILFVLTKKILSSSKQV